MKGFVPDLNHVCVFPIVKANNELFYQLSYADQRDSAPGFNMLR